MPGVEIDFVVPDSLKALALYERIFEVERVEVSGFAPGTDEAVFNIYGTRFHLLDENSDYELIAPKPGQYLPMWINVLVSDIEATYAMAIQAGCKSLQAVSPMEAFGMSSAMFADPFGYTWLLHQIHREVSFEERTRIMEERFGPGNAQQL